MSTDGRSRPDAEAARVRPRGRGRATGVRGPGRATGVLALAVMFSAGMHAALVPEHLKEMPPLGWSFIAAAALGAALAYALVTGPGDRRLARLAALFLAGEVAAWALFVTVRVPGFDGTPESIETIALVCKAVELIGLAIALPLGWPELFAARQSRRGLTRGWPAWGTRRLGRSAR